MTYAYVRVSTIEQNEARQIDALEASGIAFDRVFMDKQSGKDFNRTEWQELLGTIKNGDLLVVKSIDRLGRDYEGIIEMWRKITKEIGADIYVLDMPILDTRKNKDMLGTFISDLVLQLLSYVAQTERENIKQRQAEGIASAKARGVKLGRPCAEISAGAFESYREKVERKEISVAQACRELGISTDTWYRRVKAA